MKRKRFDYFIPPKRKGLNRSLTVFMKNRFLLLRMQKDLTRRGRPNVSTVLWWDWDYEIMNFHEAHVSVIARVIEKGTKEEWKELIGFYGLPLVIHDLKNEIRFLTEHAIEEVCAHFGIYQQEMKCFHYRKITPNHWF